jgi:hypothetical protein
MRPAGGLPSQKKKGHARNLHQAAFPDPPPAVENHHFAFVGAVGVIERFQFFFSAYKHCFILLKKNPQTK